MPGRLIIPARIPNGEVQQNQSIQYANGQVFYSGAALSLTAGQVVEAANPVVTAVLVGFAAEPAGSKLGWNAANSPTVITGRVQEVTVYKADRSTIFSSRIVVGSAVGVPVAQTDVGTAYNLNFFTVNAINEWVVNRTVTTAAVRVVDIDTDLNIVFFKCLETILGQP